MTPERLRSIESSTDTFSVEQFQRLGIRRDWDCLELGAGAGSIGRWLADRCPAGQVLAVDIDTQHLSPAANLRVLRQDITAPDFEPGRFDLVHARFVLCHLESRDEMLARVAGWLKPGGWLVVTEPYQLPAQTSPFPVLRRIMAAYQAVQPGTDLTWARQVPALLAAAGLSEVDFIGRPACMGNLAADRWRPLIDAAAPAMLAEEGITTGDLAEFHRLLDDPAFIDIPQFILTTWARHVG